MGKRESTSISNVAVGQQAAAGRAKELAFYDAHGGLIKPGSSPWADKPSKPGFPIWTQFPPCRGVDPLFRIHLPPRSAVLRFRSGGS